VRGIVRGDPGAGPENDTRPTKDTLRLWLRALSFTSMVERRVRTRLHADFGITLPRFDVMAALYDSSEGLSMGGVSRRLMVSNGNVTGIVERLDREGLVRRRTNPDDRRSQLVRLTAPGRTTFEEMAEAYQGWIVSMLSDLREEEVEQLKYLLGLAKQSVVNSDRKEQCR
jgi:DNA-binding MarR family transcriptional regulator